MEHETHDDDEDGLKDGHDDDDDDDEDNDEDDDEDDCEGVDNHDGNHDGNEEANVLVMMAASFLDLAIQQRSLFLLLSKQCNFTPGTILKYKYRFMIIQEKLVETKMPDLLCWIGLKYIGSIVESKKDL